MGMLGAPDDPTTQQAFTTDDQALIVDGCRNYVAGLVYYFRDQRAARQDIHVAVAAKRTVLHIDCARAIDGFLNLAVRSGQKIQRSIAADREMRSQPIESVDNIQGNYDQYGNEYRKLEHRLHDRYREIVPEEGRRQPS